ncbi:hypothetical protein ACI65C_007015 [Semiaphis heraclei]
MRLVQIDPIHRTKQHFGWKCVKKFSTYIQPVTGSRGARPPGRREMRSESYGISLLRTSRYIHSSKSNNQNNALPVNLDDSIDFILSPIHHDNIDEPIDTYLVVSSNSIHQNNSTNYSSGCPLYNSGDFPSKNGSHKCNKCHVPVNALLSCSTHKQGQDEIRYCLKCSKDDDEINAAYLSEEHKSVEGWNRKPKRQRNLNSYLCPNPNLRHLQINNSKNIQSLPLLKNGSRAQELKSCTITNIGKVILSNTCAFDTISSILMSWLIMVSVQKHIQKELN